MRRRTPEPSRIGSTLFVTGCLSVLAVTFVLGLYAGRHWPGLLPSLGKASAPRVEREAAGRRGGDGRPGDRSRSPETPVLTFYQELTAPLAAPPPPPKAKTDKTPAPKPASSPSELPPDSGPAPARALTRYTIQVGAFKERPPAEAMRDTLAAAGHDAYVAEVEGTDVVRYRVRVGTYTSRDQARQEAQRIGAERRLSTYVTVR